MHLTVLECGLVIMFTLGFVDSFSFHRNHRATEFYPAWSEEEDYYNYYNDADTDYAYHEDRDMFEPQELYDASIVSKRGDIAVKRFSLNELLAKLRSMVGSNEIQHTGRATFMRFGAGGR